MGNLVFQATLGGTVTLVGPNTANTTSLTLPAADGSSGQPLKTDGSGTLSFGALGVAGGGTGVTSTPTNGQLLIGNGTGFTAATLTQGNNITITNSSGGISIAATAGGNFGGDISYTDYSLTTSTALTATPTTVHMQSVSLDGTSELMILHGSSSAHAVVWNSSTNTFGTPVLVRTANFATIGTLGLAKISSTSVLMCSLPSSGTALETVVLTVSGSTVTVNTALATTLAATSDLITANTRLVTVGSSYVLNYTTNSDALPKFRAITVSGTTPSIGSQLAYAGGTGFYHSYAYSSSILLHLSADSTTVYAYPITVSGTTLTGGTAATATTTSSSICSGVLSTGRVALFYANTTGRGALVSVAATVATITTAATTLTVASTFYPQMQVFSNQAFILTGANSSDRISVLTDTAGVATVGTELQVVAGSYMVGYLSTSKVFLSDTTSGGSRYHQYGISSGAAVLEKTFQTITSTATVTAWTAGRSPYTAPLSGPPQSGSNQNTMLRNSSGKIAVGISSTAPFTTSIDGTNPAKLQQSANPFRPYNDAISDAVNWGIPETTSGTATAITMRKVTLA
jgi:hypothetical protein